jgi:hypothetical protein
MPLTPESNHIFCGCRAISTRAAFKFKALLLSAIFFPVLLASQPVQAETKAQESTAVAGFEINAGLNDAWVNADASFQGMFLTVFPEQKLIFAAWFVFDSESPPDDINAVFGAPDQRWVTALGPYDGTTAVLNAELTTGGLFNTSNPTPTQQTSYGTISLEFSDCNLALVDFDFAAAGQTGSFTMQRATTDNVALCEELGNSGPAQTSPQALTANDMLLTEAFVGFEINAGLNDAWVNADADFQGMFLTVFPALKLMFAAWFTFDSVEISAEAPAVFGAPDQRWITALGPYEGASAQLKAEMRRVRCQQGFAG